MMGQPDNPMLLEGSNLGEDHAIGSHPKLK